MCELAHGYSRENGVQGSRFYHHHHHVRDSAVANPDPADSNEHWGGALILAPAPHGLQVAQRVRHRHALGSPAGPFLSLRPPAAAAAHAAAGGHGTATVRHPGRNFPPPPGAIWGARPAASATLARPRARSSSFHGSSPALSMLSSRFLLSALACTCLELEVAVESWAVR